MKTLTIFLTIILVAGSCLEKKQKVSIMIYENQPGFEVSKKNGKDNFFFMSEIPSDRVLIGTGFNSATLEAKGKVVKFYSDKDLTKADIASGQRTFYDLDFINSYTDLFKSLNINVQASLKIGPFKGSAAYQIYNETKISELNTYLLTKVIVQNPAQILRSKILTDTALQIANSNDDELFLERFGDEFIYGKITGGELYCLFQFESNSLAEKKAIYTKVSAAYNKFAGGAKGNTEWASTLSEIKNISNIKIRITRSGDNSSIPENNVDSLISYAKRFPRIVSKNPVVLTLLTEEILNIENLPRSVRKKDFEPILNQRRVLEKIATRKLEIESVNQKIQDLLERQEEIEITAEQVANAKFVMNFNSKVLEYIKDISDYCYFDFKNCSFDDGKLESIDFGFDDTKYLAKADTIHVLSQEEYVFKNSGHRIRVLNFIGKWQADPNTPPNSCYNENSKTDTRYSNSRGCLPPVLSYSVDDINREYDFLKMTIYSPSLLITIQNNLSGQVEQSTIFDGNPIQVKPNSKIVIKPQCQFVNCSDQVEAVLY